MKRGDGDVCWECPRCRAAQWQPPHVLDVHHNCSGTVVFFKRKETQ